MGLTPVVNKKLVTGEQDFAHDVAILPKMSSSGFNTEVVETKELGITIVLDNLIADMVEAKDDVSAGNDVIRPLVGYNVL